MKHVFSTLLSVYCKEKPHYLELALNSIWAGQTVKPAQIVIIKDGELTPELNHILDDFAKTVPVDFVINEKNIGLSASLNKGLLACKHDLVARMDTDDIAYPNRFEKQIAFFEEYPETDILGSFATKINKDGEIDGEMKVPITNNEIYKMIWTNPFIHPSVMFKKASILSVGNYEIPNDKRVRHDDYELWFRCALKKFKFQNIPEPLIYYRYIEDTVKKNNRVVAWNRFKVGVKGCYKLRLSPIVYLGLCFPLFRSILPYPLNVYFNKLMLTINPRNK
jgi:glycosyltransferase involved in cell wall biosynthesis